MKNFVPLSHLYLNTYCVSLAEVDSLLVHESEAISLSLNTQEKSKCLYQFFKKQTAQLCDTNTGP